MFIFEVRCEESFTSQSKRAEIPQDKMVLGSAGDKTVSLAHQVIPKGNRVGLNLLGICLEARRHGLFQSNGKGTDLVVVRTTLKGREDSEVDFVLKIINCILGLPLLGRLRSLPEEDHTRPRPPQALVGCCCHNVTVLERIINFLHKKKQKKTKMLLSRPNKPRSSTTNFETYVNEQQQQQPSLVGYMHQATPYRSIINHVYI